MKVFFSLLLAVSLIITYPAFCFAQSKSAPTKYWGVPIGEQSTKLSAIYPYFKEVTVSKQFVENQKAADPVRYELNVIDGKIQRLETAKQRREQRQRLLERAAPQDNTRVVRPVIPERIIKKSKGLDQALQRSRLSREEKEIADLKRRRAELTKKLNASGLSRSPLGDKNFNTLSAQAKINEAYNLYKKFSSHLDNPNKYKQVPEFKASPKQLQQLIAEEIKNFNSQLQQGPAYKSFVSLQKEIDLINKNKRDDAILMSIFTLVALRKFNGVSIAAPSSTLAFWSLPRFTYYGKKILNFIGVVSAYSLIDSANLNAINTSFEEMLTRFTALEDNMAFLQKLIKDGETNIFGNSYDPIPSAWSKNPDDDTHYIVLRQLYGLRAINTYLKYSTVHYKYDLAMLDFFNLFSSLQEVPFDISYFEHYHNGNKGAFVIENEKDDYGNEVPVRKWKNGKSDPSKAYLNGDYSLISKTNAEGNPTQLIKDLNKLPPFVYYRKTYYKDFSEGKREKPWMVRLDPLYIIRDKNGSLRYCGLISNRFREDGYPMASSLGYDSHYYMRIEPVIDVSEKYYQDKPKTYVFEDINTSVHSCEDIEIMA